MFRATYNFELDTLELAETDDMLLAKYRKIGPAAVRAAIRCAKKDKPIYPK